MRASAIGEAHLARGIIWGMHRYECYDGYDLMLLLVLYMW